MSKVPVDFLLFIVAYDKNIWSSSFAGQLFYAPGPIWISRFLSLLFSYFNGDYKIRINSGDMPRLPIVIRTPPHLQ